MSGGGSTLSEVPSTPPGSDAGAGEPESPLGQMLDRAASPRTAVQAQAIPGHLAGVDSTGSLLFQADAGGDARPVAIGIEVGDAALVEAARQRRRAVALVVPGQAPEWTLVALVRDRLTRGTACVRPEVVVDGETVRVEAGQRLELRCGDARIVLSADGKVLIHGMQVVSRAEGQNRIRGGSVQIN